MNELLASLKTKCETRGLEFTDAELNEELKDAISAVNERRGFKPSSTVLFEQKYERLIVKLALYSITKIGAEGETTHQENGINRIYSNAGDYPDDLMNEIIPLIRV